MNQNESEAGNSSVATRIKFAQHAEVTTGFSLSSLPYPWLLPSFTLSFSKAGLLVIAGLLASVPLHVLCCLLFPTIYPGDCCHPLGPSFLARPQS